MTTLPAPTGPPVYPWCRTCGERLVLDVDAWLVHTWQADDQEFTDETYPIDWKPTDTNRIAS